MNTAGINEETVNTSKLIILTLKSPVYLPALFFHMCLWIQDSSAARLSALFVLHPILQVNYFLFVFVAMVTQEDSERKKEGNTKVGSFL